MPAPGRDACPGKSFPGDSRTSGGGGDGQDMYFLNGKAGLGASDPGASGLGTSGGGRVDSGESGGGGLGHEANLGSGRDDVGGAVANDSRGTRSEGEGGRGD